MILLINLYFKKDAAPKGQFDLLTTSIKLREKDLCFEMLNIPVKFYLLERLGSNDFIVERRISLG